MSEDALPKKRGRPRKAENKEVQEQIEIQVNSEKSEIIESSEKQVSSKTNKNCSIEGTFMSSDDSAKNGDSNPMTVFVVSESSMIDMCMIKQEPEDEEPCSNQDNNGQEDQGKNETCSNDVQEDGTKNELVVKQEPKYDGLEVGSVESDVDDDDDVNERHFKTPEQSVRHNFVSKSPQISSHQNNKIFIRTPDGTRSIQNPITIVNGNSKKVCYIIKNDGKSDRTIYLEKPLNKMSILSSSKPNVVLEKPSIQLQQKSVLHNSFQNKGVSMLKSSQMTMFKQTPKTNSIVLQSPSYKETSVLKLSSVSSLQTELDSEEDTLTMDTSTTDLILQSSPVHKKVSKTFNRPDTEFNLRFTNQTGKF